MHIGHILPHTEANTIFSITTYPISDIQQGLLFHSLYENRPGLYIIQWTIQLSETIDLKRLQIALDTICARHDALKTSFNLDNGDTPTQHFHKNIQLPIAYSDFSGLTKTKQQAIFSNLLLQDRHTGFNLKTPPLARAHLCKFSAKRFTLIFTHHHAIASAYGTKLILTELFKLYDASLENIDITLPKLKKYSDYIQQVENTDFATAESYWKTLFKNYTHANQLPRQNIASGIENQTQQIATALTTQKTKQLINYTQANKITPNVFFQAAWGILLTKYTESEDIVFGVVRGMSRNLIDNIAGMFINTLPVRANFTAQLTNNEYLENISQQNRAIKEFVHTPLNNIQRWVSSDTKSALFETVVEFKPYSINEELRSLGGKWHTRTTKFIADTNYPLLVEIYFEENRYHIKLNYDNHLFSEKLIQQLSTHYLNIINQLLNNVEIEKISCLLPKEEKKLLAQWGYAKEKTLTINSFIELFEKQVTNNPDSIAVSDEQAAITYQELNHRANALAAYLAHKKKLKVGTFIGVFHERNVNLLTIFLGILKAGGVYIPIDPDFPPARIEHVTKDSQLKHIITSPSLNKRLTSITSKSIKVLEYTDLSTGKTLKNKLPKIAKHHGAYVIYTSGSTNQPKGVLVGHQALANLLCAMQNVLQLNNKDILLSLTRYTFDISGLEFYLPLIVGAQVVIANRTQAIDPQEIIKTIKQQKISVIQSTPIMWQMLLDSGWVNDGKIKILCGGEALSTSTAIRLNNAKNNVWNVYGPTETTIWSSYYPVTANSLISTNLPYAPIGKPILNTQFYILDKQLRPVPAGVIGELYIGGMGLAQGYVNNKQLTKEKFIKNPFSNKSSKQLYKTGDLVRWLFDGNIEYIGRTDDQIKINGYRIGLKEIESALLEHAKISQCAVTVITTSNQTKHLAAYFTTSNKNTQPTVNELQGFLRQSLPEYMVPRFFMQLKHLPVNFSDKVDRKRLPAINVNMPNILISPKASNSKQQKLIAIWADVLKVDAKKINLNSNFFDLGGNSLTATQTISRINTFFNTTFNVRIIFDSPTISSLYEKLLDEQNNTNIQPYILTSSTKNNIAPLSYPQEQLWFLYKLDPKNPFYNILSTLEIEGKLNLTALYNTLLTLIKRHSALRTRFIIENNVTKQAIIPENKLKFTLEVETFPKTNKNALAELISHEREKPFNLSEELPFRIRLIRYNNKHLLLFCLHHIIADEWSYKLLANELAIIYQAYIKNKPNPLPALKLQYTDFAIWQREWLTERLLKPQLNYWEKQLKNLTPLNIATDHSRPKVQTFRGNYINFYIPKALTKKFKQILQNADITLFTGLLSVFNILLFHYSQQEDIAIASPTSGRHYASVENIFGYFLNTLVLRTNIREMLSFNDLINNNREIVLAAFAHQDLPFEKVVEALKPERDLSRNPLSQVAFILQTLGKNLFKLPSLKIKTNNVNNLKSKFDLTLFAEEINEQIECRFEYSTDLFKESTIKRMIQHFKNIFTHIVESPNKPISKINIHTEQELHLILDKWNNTKVKIADRTLPELFEAQVLKSKNKPAIIFEDQQLSYEQLNTTANQLAHYLKNAGLKPETFVAIMLERSPEAIIAMLAVTKAGGTYIPLSPHYPAHRIKLILTDCKPTYIIAQANLVSKLQTYPNKKAPYKLIDINLIKKELFKFKTKNLNSFPKPNQLAYVMYTSGSTGTPKGVAIEHHSLTNCLLGLQKNFKLTATDKFLALTSFGFDISALEIYMPLITGGTCVLHKEGTHTTPKEIQTIINKHNITVMQTTPSLWQILVNNHLSSNQPFTVLSGGEPLPSNLAKKLLLLGAKVWNLYGPTETTIWSTAMPLHEQPKLKTIPSIGKPIANTEVYVLDKNLKPTPIGVAGELYIGGHGVARGYLNQKTLTENKFIKNPFVKDPKATMYNTGDLARWLDTGYLEYIGRNDNQVKINGVRIELEEIEQTLVQHPSIKQATVTISTINDNKVLAAYIVADINYKHGKLPSHVIELQNEQITHWKTIYNEVFKQSNTSTKPLFNTNGWNSSYNGHAIPEIEMTDWAKNTAEKILRLSPKNILEIGCGTGLLLFLIAPHCEQYTASDISSSALDYVKQQVKNTSINNITLLERSAEHFTSYESRAYDTIVINSVIQYFPHLTYFTDVIEKALLCLKPDGQMYIGDIRSLVHLELFHCSVQLYKATHLTTIQEVLNAIRTKVNQEEELIILHEFFYKFAEANPIVTAVDIQLKRGNYKNEMNCFRYDVVLHTKKITDIPQNVPHYKWQTNFSIKKIEDILNEANPEFLFITEIPNARISGLQYALETLQQESSNNLAHKLHDNMQHAVRKAVDPSEIWHLAAQKGYQAYITWSTINPSSSIDVIFYKDPTKIVEVCQITQSYYRHIKEKNKSNLIFANQPLQNKLTQQLTPVLRNYLKDKLPRSMLPNTFIFMSELPLTNSGKIDRKALPTPDSKTTNKQFLAAKSETEKLVVKMWQNLFNSENVSVNDNFFELGGNSILAIQIMTAIHKQFDIELTLPILFEAPTPLLLSHKIDQQLQKSQIIEESNDINSNLITLNNKGNYTPLFLIHPIGGTVFCYTQLAKHLGTQRPIYAIQDPGLHTQKTLFNNVTEMAKCYLNMIKNVQPHGPYLIGGASFGGTISFEICKLLEQENEKVTILLLDAWAKFTPIFKSKKRLNKVVQNQYSLLKSLLTNSEIENPAPWLDINFHRLKMNLAYQVPFINSKVILFKATHLLPEYIDIIDGTNHWQSHCTQPIEVHQIEGDHFTILIDPHAEDLAEKMNSSMNKYCKNKVEKK